MSLYWNADGELQNFEEWDQLAVCSKCGKPYKQRCEEQVPGFRDRSEDICPYCGNTNGFSMSVEYWNYPLSEEELTKYFKSGKEHRE